MRGALVLVLVLVLLQCVQFSFRIFSQDGGR
jgi:hypothetical protein